MLATLEELPMGVWVARVPGGEFVYSNRMFAEIMGMPPHGDARVGEYSARYQLQDRDGHPYPEEKLPFVQALHRRRTVVVDDIVVQRSDGSRNLVEAMGGTIVADAAPEGGALFSVRLPVVRGATPAPGAAPPARLRSNGARRRVLIVDDERQLTQIFRLSLPDEYDLHILNSGRAALAHLLEGATYDLVLCDLMMPGFSGMDLYQELHLRAPGREKSLVFMTGGVFDPQVGEFLASVPNDCIDKPFDVRAEVRRRLG